MRRFLPLLGLVFALAVSCRQNNPENIALPYAKKKNDACPAEKARFEHFLWLQNDSVFGEEIQHWLEHELEASQAYLSALTWKARNTRPQTDFASNPQIRHKVLPICPIHTEDSAELHLYYRADLFGSGVKPLVMTFFDTVSDSLVPPVCFFDEGGILAVLRQIETTDTVDSLDSLPVRDTIDLERQLFGAMNVLISEGYTTPRKTALVLREKQMSFCREVLFLRPDFFRAVYLEPISDSLCDEDWADFTQTPDNPSYPSLLITNTPSHYYMVAYLQEQNQRKCGRTPVLLCEKTDYETLWKFLLYPITEKNRLIHRGKAGV
ncbi:MAG: hypothetical protein K2K11_05340 [Bacteroidales bacterium]|nr:hypothetical protein [Bacteroidales bacterium]